MSLKEDLVQRGRSGRAVIITTDELNILIREANTNQWSEFTPCTDRGLIERQGVVGWMLKDPHDPTSQFAVICKAMLKLNSKISDPASSKRSQEAVAALLRDWIDRKTDV